MKKNLLLMVALASLGGTGLGRAWAQARQGEIGHRRILDLEFHPLLSIPDAIGVCLEAFPMRRGLSIEGCTAIQVFEAFALSLNAAYRFRVYDGPTLALGLGPAVGSHAIFDTPRGPLIDVSADGFASFEAVWWGETTGFQAQLGAGAMVMAWDRPSGINDRWVPIVDLTLGIAFRTGGIGGPVGASYHPSR
jgi:hypothetical protein